MVNVIVNTQGMNTVTYDTDTHNVDDGFGLPDTIQGLAAQAGIVDAAEGINQESREIDEGLRQQETDSGDEQGQIEQEDVSDPEAQPEKKKRHRKRKVSTDSGSEKRIADLSLRYGQTFEEKKYFEEQWAIEREKSAAYEKELLKIRGSAYQNEIDRMGDVVIEARNSGDIDLEKQAMAAMSKLTNSQLRQEEELQRVEWQEQQRRQQELQAQQEQEQAAADPRDQFAKEFFDRRELSGDGFDEWLSDNPELDPYSEDFDPDYASEVHKIKKGLNSWLSSQRNKKIIGTDEYYDILNESIDRRFGRTPEPIYQEQYAPAPQQQRQAYNSRYQNQNYQQGGQVQPMAMRTIELDRTPRTPVASVNRAGYNGGPYSGQGLPQLNDIQRMIAHKSPMVDDRGRPIIDLAAKERIYQEELVRMQRERT